jgi:hypothetical protein
LAALRRQETAPILEDVDVRYLKGHKLGGRAYVISVLANHSRAVLSSALTRTQDLASYLSVLYAASVGEELGQHRCEYLGRHDVLVAFQDTVPPVRQALR